jgi:hypothetical protein
MSSGDKDKKHRQIIEHQLDLMGFEPSLKEQVIRFVLQDSEGKSRRERLLEIAQGNNFFLAQKLSEKFRRLFFGYVLDGANASERTDRMSEFMEIVDFFKREKITKNFHEQFLQFISRGNGTTVGRQQRIVLLKSYWRNLVGSRVHYTDARGIVHAGIAMYIEPMPTKQIESYVKKGVRVEPFWALVEWSNHTSSTIPIDFLQLEDS